jgi:hypothetical protein
MLHGLQFERPAAACLIVLLLLLLAFCVAAGCCVISRNKAIHNLAPPEEFSVDSCLLV